MKVGDGFSDHYCWQRPEDMTTSRQAYSISENNPGSELAAETAAAMAAASMVFLRTDPSYSLTLLEHAKQVIIIIYLFSIPFFQLALSSIVHIQYIYIYCGNAEMGFFSNSTLTFFIYFSSSLLRILIGDIMTAAFGLPEISICPRVAMM